MEAKTKILLAILILAAFLRFYKISSNPPGLYLDEISFGYNAYSILKTGRDEYGVFLPVVLKSYGDYKAPLYAYLLVPTIAVFGLNEFAVRFPSAFLGTFTVLLAYFLTHLISKDKKTALIASAVLAISPWHLQFSRAGFEANVMIFFSVLGILLFLKSEWKLKWLISSAVSFGLAFNAYHGARIWVPLILFLIALFYFKEILKFKVRIILPIIIFAAFIIPSILHFNEVVTRGTDVTILNNKNAPQVFMENYLSHFSPTFLFFSGDSIGRHSVPGMGELYIFEIPFLLFGLLYVLRQKEKNYKILVAWLLISPVPAAIATPAPHALRDLTSIPLWSMIIAFGIISFTDFKINRSVKVLCYLVISTVAIYNIITYFHLYYVHYPKEKAIDWSGGVKQMVKYIEPRENGYQRIYVTKSYAIPYIYFLFYTKYDPSKYLAENGNPDHFGKYYFYSNSKEITGENVLIVSDAGGNPKNIQKEIYLNGNNLIYKIGSQ